MTQTLDMANSIRHDISNTRYGISGHKARTRYIVFPKARGQITIHGISKVKGPDHRIWYYIGHLAQTPDMVLHKALSPNTRHGDTQGIEPDYHIWYFIGH